MPLEAGKKVLSDRSESKISPDFFHDVLLNDVEPFWSRHAVDRVDGGFLHCLERDGAVFSATKQVWAQSRMIWCYARLYNRVERRPEWLALSRHGTEFLLAHCFRPDGRMTTFVTGEGRLIGATPDPYSLGFAVLGLAEYALASGNDRCRTQAVACFDAFMEDLATAEGRDPSTGRRRRHLGKRMMLLTLLPVLSRIDDRSRYAEVADRCRREILKWFYRPKHSAVLQVVKGNGRPVRGRLVVCPGHILEVSWLLLDDALTRQRPHRLPKVLQMMTWALEQGWDQEYGGLFLFTGPPGHPGPDHHGQRKYWWPHAEALCATMLAYALTREPAWLEWYERIFDYTFSAFPDPEFGEWYAYLSRDGVPEAGLTFNEDGTRPLSAVKGDALKSGFHLMRALLVCREVSAAIADGRGNLSDPLWLR